jgi:hypothetical protein
LERENGQNLAAFSDFFGLKTDHPPWVFIGEGLDHFAIIFGSTFAHKSLE